MMPRVCLAAVIGRVSASAQSIYPIPGIPYTRDGKPNPHGTRSQGRDGKPDLSGLWQRLRTPARAGRAWRWAPTWKTSCDQGKRPGPSCQRSRRFSGNGRRNFMADRPQHVRRMASRTGCSSVRLSRSGADAHPVRRIRTTPPDFLRSTAAPYGVPAGVARLFDRPRGRQLVRSRHARLQPPELAR